MPRSLKPRRRRASRPPSRRRRITPQPVLRRLNTLLGPGEGSAGFLLVLERSDGRRRWCECTAVVSEAVAGPGRRRRGMRASNTGSVSRILAAVGHRVRVAIVLRLLEGPAVYRALQRLTALTPGPLYYHLQQLRLAGLLMPKERDLYALTPLGRRLGIVIALVGRVIAGKVGGHRK